MRIGMVVVNSAIGGTEKRFSNLFRLLSIQAHNNYHMFIPEVLYQKYIKYRLLDDAHSQRITRLYQTGLKAIYPLAPFQVAGFEIRGLAKFVKPLWRKELRQSIEAVKPDILHIALPTDHLRPLPKIPIVVELANNNREHFNTWFIKHAVRSEALFNCGSELIKTALEETFPDHNIGKRAFVSPCSFIDYSRIKFDPQKRRNKKIVFVGRFEPVKNPFLFLNAIAILSQKRTDFTAELSGSGSMETQIRSWIDKHQLHEQICVTYSIDPTETLSSALAFVTVITSDNYHSQALMEAMACGCAIIATDVGETKKLVDENCGFLTGFSAEEIAMRLDYLLDHEDTARSLGENARSKVMREQTFERYASYLDELYQKCFETQIN